MNIDRSFVLKSFLDKVQEAKRYNMSDVRMSIRELDQLAYVIYQLMSEDLSVILDYLETQKNNTNSEPVEHPQTSFKVSTNTEIEQEEQDDEDDDEEEYSLYGGTF